MKTRPHLSTSAPVVLAVLLAACGSTEPEGEEVTIVGFWFACELGQADGCAILDDDGHQFTAAGEIYDIEESAQTSEPACAGSPCFPSSRASVNVDRLLVGTYEHDGSSLSVTIGACSETVPWTVGSGALTYQVNCLDNFEDAADALVRKYTGTVIVN